MPKATKVGSFRKTAEAVKGTTDAPPSTLSRGQRKRQAKRQQYLQREKLVLSSLLLKKKEEQKKRIDGLDALREALVGVSDSKKKKKESSSTNRMETNRAKKEMTAQEVTHLDLVLEHPSFKTNPFGTIQEHLRNTLKEQAKELEVKSKERTRKDEQEEAAKKEKKRERRAEHGGKHRKKFHATRRSRR